MEKNKILVTGASGFIGSHLVKELIAKKQRPVVILRKKSNLWRLQNILNKIDIIYGDLEDKKQLEKIIKKIKPEIIYHLASYGVVNGQINIDKIKRINLDATINLLDACVKVGFKHFIHTGSCFEYGSSERTITENTLLKPETDYAVFKAASTLYCLKRAIAEKLPITILRPFTAYGPSEEKARLIPTIMLSIINKSRPEISSPKPVRNFIYVKDLARAYLAIANKAVTFGEIYNVGSNKDYSIGSIIKIVENISGARITPKYLKKLKRSYESAVWKTSYKKIFRDTGWKPRYDIKKGLRETYNWFLDNNSLYQ
jgi:nucleoside-diphosphate-sugar epimerase